MLIILSGVICFTLERQWYQGMLPLMKVPLYMVLTTALIMGGLFGLIFGVMDVEDEVSYQIRLALLREERYCYPVGAILGGIVGFMNEYIREEEERCGNNMPNGFDEDI